MAAALYFCRTPLRLATERRHRATVIACLACGALLHMLTWEIAPMLSPHSQLAFPGVNLLDPTAKVFAERCDSYEPRLPHRGGWAVAERCLRPLDMLVFAHCSVREWRRHAALRDTLFEDTALRRLNWTRVFFSGRPSNNKDLNAWLDLEADLTGDLVVLPFKNGNFNITPKFVEGMRWVDDHCPTVQKVIKIDDGVMIHPFKLQEYYRQEVVQKPEYLHCGVSVNSDVIRDPHGRYYVSEEDLPARKKEPLRGRLSHHDLRRDAGTPQGCIAHIHSSDGAATGGACETSIALSQQPTSPHGMDFSQRGVKSDDGYGFGDLALAVGIGHVELQRFMEWNENRTDCVSYGICMLTLEGTKYGANSRRRGQWGLLL
ncbi:uncharacterized protein LOC144110560 [Amblyomma americanum]